MFLKCFTEINIIFEKIMTLDEAHGRIWIDVCMTPAVETKKKRV